MGRFVPLLVPALLILAVPAASAHTTVTTSDGKYFVTVGHLNEPTTTFMKTGLDLIVRANNSGARGAGIAGLQLTLNATMTAPNGETHGDALRAQFGVAGGYSFDKPMFLTQPGEYYLKLTGRINQTNVDIPKILVGSGPISAMEGLMFPDSVSSPMQLEARLKALETQNTELQGQVAALREQIQKSPAKTSPSVGGVDVLLLAGVVGLAAARWRRVP